MNYKEVASQYKMTEARVKNIVVALQDTGSDITEEAIASVNQIKITKRCSIVDAVSAYRNSGHSDRQPEQRMHQSTSRATERSQDATQTLNQGDLQLAQAIAARRATNIAAASNLLVLQFLPEALESTEFSFTFDALETQLVSAVDVPLLEQANLLALPAATSDY